MKIKLTHIDKEHERLLSLGITGYRDVVLREAVKHPDGEVELTAERYNVVADWKAKRIADPSAPPTPRYQPTPPPCPASSTATKKKGCGCGAGAAEAWKTAEGPKMWAELHARAQAYAGDDAAEKMWLESFEKRIGCDDCREHWGALVTQTPPDFGGADQYHRWTVSAHNAVNRRLGKAEWPPAPSAGPEVWVAGYPSNYGGADTELMAQIYLWRAKGCAVNLVPMFGLNEETRAVCTNLGCVTHPYRPGIFKDKVVVSFCNGEFLARLDEIYANGRPRAVVWMNCMTWLFPAEKAAHARGYITHFGYQTAYQRDKLATELAEIRPVHCFDYRPYYSVENNAQGIRFAYSPPTDYFGAGRISRDDANKYAVETWSIFNSIESPKPVKAFILGFGPQAKQRCGPAPVGLDAQTWEPGGIGAAELLKRIHVLIHKTGGSRENYPRTILEAWNAGAVPIFEKAWGLAEIIDDGVNGFLCETGAEMVAKASLLASDEPLRKRMVEAGYEKLTREIASVDGCWKSWGELLSLAPQVQV